MTTVETMRSPSTPGDAGRRRYDLGVAAVERLRAHSAPLTAVTFELWFRRELEPGGPLAAVLDRIEADKIRVCDALCDELAARFLASSRVLRGLRGGNDQLAKELSAVQRIIADARGDQKAFENEIVQALPAIDVGAGPPRGEATEVLRSLRKCAVAMQDKARLAERELAVSQAGVQHLQHHLDRLRREVETDGLTGLANRKAFDLALAARLDGGGATLLALMDIDHFKRFNDTWGHATGDEVLRFVSAAIADCGRPPRLAARYGGEEFALLFSGEEVARARASLEKLQARLRGRLLTRRATGEQLGSATISIGLARLREGETGEALVSRADEALYFSKREGRDRLTLAAD